MYGKLHLDIFNSNKFLLNNMNIKVKFYKNDTNFSLMFKEGETFDINIDEIYLNVRKVKISQEIIFSLLMNLLESFFFGKMTL